MRDCPGIGWVAKSCLCVFSGHSLWGRKTHKQNPPTPKSRDNPLGLPSLQKCLWNFWWNLIWNSIWNLKFPMGQIWWNFWGGLFYLPGKHETIRGEFRTKFRTKLVSNFATFFGNFVQQKGGASNPLKILFTSFFLFMCFCRSQERRA